MVWPRYFWTISLALVPSFFFGSLECRWSVATSVNVWRKEMGRKVGM